MIRDYNVSDIREWRREAVGETGPLRAAGKMTTEASEVLDLYIKADDWVNHEVDKLELQREVGDVFVTLVGICQEEDLRLNECVAAAMEKNTSEEWREKRGL